MFTAARVLALVAALLSRAPAATADGESLVPVLRTALAARDEKPIKEIVARKAGSVPGLIPVLAEKDWQMRGLGAQLLGLIGPEAKGAVAALVPLLRDENEQVRVIAGGALDQIAVGPAARDVAPALIDAAWAPTQKPLAAAVHAGVKAILLRIGREDSSLLLPLLRREDRRAREDGASLLGQIGPGAAAAIPDLVKMLKGEDGFTRFNGLAESAGAALGKIGAEAVPHLAAVLREGKGAAVEAALIGLERAGPAAAPAVADLARFLESPRDGGSGVDAARRRAAQALRAIGPAAQPAAAALTDVYQGKDVWLRCIAAGALARIGAPPQGVVPYLTGVLRDDKFYVHRQVAADALGDLGPAAQEAVPVLQNAALMDPYDQHKSAVGWGLSTTGMTQFPVRAAALAALRKIKP